MENVLNGLQSELVFKYFEEISQIPRGSGNEKAISDYLKKFGEDLGLETIQDDTLNIIIRKPATHGSRLNDSIRQSDTRPHQSDHFG